MKKLSHPSLIVVALLLGILSIASTAQTAAPVDLQIVNEDNPGSSTYNSWSPFYIVIEGPAGGWVGLTLDVSLFAVETPQTLPIQMEPLYLAYEWLRPPVPTLASTTPLASILAPGSDQHVGVSVNNTLVNIAWVLQYSQCKQTCQPLLGPTGNEAALSSVSRDWDAKCATWIANNDGPGSIQELWRMAFQFDEPDAPGMTGTDSKRFAPSPLAIEVAAHEAGGMTQLNDFLNATCLVLTGDGGVPITNFQALQSPFIGIRISMQAFVGWNPTSVMVYSFENELNAPALIHSEQSAALIKLSQTKSIDFVMGVLHVTTREMNTTINGRLIGWYAEPDGFALPMIDSYHAEATFLYRGQTYTSTSYILNGLYCYFPAPLGISFNPWSTITILGLSQGGYYESMQYASLNPIVVKPAVPAFVKYW